MPIDIVDRILEGLRTAQARHNAIREQEAQAARDEVARKESEARIKRDQDTLKQQKERDDAVRDINRQQLEIAQKAADLTHMQAQQKIISDYQETGVAPIGTVTGPTRLGVAPQKEGEVQMVPSTETNMQTFNIPGIGETLIQTPRAAARESAYLEEIRNRPKVEAQINAIEASKSADFARMMVQNAWDDDRARRSENAAMDRLKLQLQSDIDLAKFKQGGGEYNLTPYIMDGIDGNLSREDILKLPIPTGAQMNIMNGIINNGARPLTKDQIALTGDFQQMVDAIGLMDEVIRNQAQTTNYATSFASGLVDSFDTSVKGPEQQLAGRASIIARGFAKEKGALSNQDIDRIKKGFIPSRFDPVTVNIKKRDSYRVELEKVIDAKLSNLPPKQREIIKKRLGLLDIGLYGQKQQPKAQPINAPTNVNPAALELLRKHGIQVGQ